MCEYSTPFHIYFLLLTYGREILFSDQIFEIEALQLFSTISQKKNSIKCIGYIVKLFRNKISQEEKLLKWNLPQTKLLKTKILHQKYRNPKPYLLKKESSRMEKLLNGISDV